jgi:hypothetical protein
MMIGIVETICEKCYYWDIIDDKEYGEH